MGLKRLKGRRTYALDALKNSLKSTVPAGQADLYDALLMQVGGEQRRADELAAKLVSAGLAQMRENEGLKERWQSLSRRQQEVTALTCLGYTNRQIAGRLVITEDTVKSHVKNTLVKFNVHGKLELQKALQEWDFSEWDK